MYVDEIEICIDIKFLRIACALCNTQPADVLIFTNSERVKSNLSSSYRNLRPPVENYYLNVLSYVTHETST